jgi:HD-GYP domain-containing protein (c-di-GMP phosphodiesterase class II)
MARIIAIAGGYEEMTGRRPYREAMGPDEALHEIEVQAGRMYDPDLVDLFKGIVQNIKK